MIPKTRLAAHFRLLLPQKFLRNSLCNQWSIPSSPIIDYQIYQHSFFDGGLHDLYCLPYHLRLQHTPSYRMEQAKRAQE